MLTNILMIFLMIRRKFQFLSLLRLETKCLVVCFSIALSGVWCLIHFGCLGKKSVARMVKTWTYTLKRFKKLKFAKFSFYGKNNFEKISLRVEIFLFTKTVGFADIGFLPFIFINFHCVKAQMGRRREN